MLIFAGTTKLLGHGTACPDNLLQGAGSHRRGTGCRAPSRHSAKFEAAHVGRAIGRQTQERRARPYRRYIQVTSWPPKIPSPCPLPQGERVFATPYLGGRGRVITLCNHLPSLRKVSAYGAPPRPTRKLTLRGHINLKTQHF